MFTNQRVYHRIRFFVFILTVIFISRLTLVYASLLFNIGNVSLNWSYREKSPYEQSLTLAAALFQRATQVNSTSQNGWRSLGYAYLMNGKISETVDAWGNSKMMPMELAFYSQKSYEAQEYSETLRWTDLGITISPKYGDWFFYQGLVLEENQEIEKAIESLALSIDQPLLTLSISDIYFRMGLLYQAKNPPDFELSFEAINKGIELSDFSKPQYELNSYFERGEILRRQGNGAQAIADYEWVLRNQPSHYWSHIALGTLYWETKSNFIESEQMFLDAVALQPRMKRAYEKLGQLYKEQNLTTKAIEIYEKLLQQYPNDQFAIEQIQILQDSLR